MELPAWFKFNVQVPTPIADTTPAETLHIAEEEESTETTGVRPDVDEVVGV